MNFLNRAFVSIKNQFSKTLILFLTTFILGNILCAAFTIAQSAIQTKDDFEKNYGSKISLNYNNYHLTALSGADQDISYQKYLYLVDNLSKYDCFVYFDYALMFHGLQSNELKYKDETNVLLDLYLWGSCEKIPADFKNYNVKLTAGRTFNDEEIKQGKKVLILNENFHYRNGQSVQVGDQLNLQRNVYDYYDQSFIKQETVTYEVIGLYKKTDKISQNNNIYSFDKIDVRCYVPNTTILLEEQKFAQLNPQEKNNYVSVIGPSFFQLVSVNWENFILKEIHKHDKELPSLSISTSKEIFEKISKPMESLIKIADFLLITTTVLMILILNFVIFLLLRNREHEIGILVSLGEKKIKIIAQFLIEVGFVAIVALGLSIYSGNQLGKYYSQYLLSNKIEMNYEELTIEEMEIQEELLEKYEVSFDEQYIQKVILLGSSTILISCILPICYITSKKPKKILK